MTPSTPSAPQETRSESLTRSAFDQAAAACHKSKSREFRNRKHAAKATLDTYASPIIGSLSVEQIDLGHVVKVLEPIWTTKIETAARLRGRIEACDELRGGDYSTRIVFGKAHKVVVRFKIITMGEHFRTIIERWYRVLRIVGKPKKRGDFKVAKSSHIVREYARLTRPAARLDRISFVALKDVVVIGRTRTVREDHDQRDLHGDLRYSVIDELIEIEEMKNLTSPHLTLPNPTREPSPQSSVKFWAADETHGRNSRNSGFE